MSLDIVLFPSCDIHIARHGAPSLQLRVMGRDFAPDFKSYTLSDVTNQSSFHYFSPYKAVGSRLDSCVTISSNGIITPISLGITFVHIDYNEHYIIARIQVHDTITGYVRFGNQSLTVPKDNNFAQTQVSLFALFSDDASEGTSIIGDITGHGYVTLVPADNSICALDAFNRED